MALDETLKVLREQANGLVWSRRNGVVDPKPKIVLSPIRKRAKTWKASYGLSLEQVRTMFDTQNGRCLICEILLHWELVDFDVDHCHRTESVRGLLCPSCNIGLGMFKDNVAALQRAIRYLAGDL